MIRCPWLVLDCPSVHLWIPQLALRCDSLSTSVSAETSVFIQVLLVEFTQQPQLPFLAPDETLKPDSSLSTKPHARVSGTKQLCLFPLHSLGSRISPISFPSGGPFSTTSPVTSTSHLALLGVCFPEATAQIAFTKTLAS